MNSVEPREQTPAQPAAGLTADAFRALFAQQFGLMVSLARLLGADDPEAVAQDAFVGLFRQRHRLRDAEAAPAYLRRSVVNLSRNAKRHLAIGRSVVPTAVDDVRSAESTVLARDDVATTLTAIDTLPTRRRAALILRHWLDLSYDDVGHALGVSPSSARSLVHRAVAEVRKSLSVVELQGDSS